MNLYRKYRPQVFSEVVGQAHVVETLRRALETERVSHAYLFCGSRGIGKTTLARLLAKAVNCTGKGERPCGKCPNCREIAAGKFIDLIEIDAASNRGSDEIRDLREKVRFSPNIGKKKVYIIDEVHMLTREAFNALLKTLEEPPAHVMFIFATTEAGKLPETIISRCQRFNFRLGSEAEIVKSLRRIAAKENLKLSDEVIRVLVRAASGSYRDALSLLDQLSAHLIKKEISSKEALVLLHLTDQVRAEEFLQILERGQAAAGLEYLADLKEKGADFEKFLRDLTVQARGEMVGAIRKGEETVWLNGALKRLIAAAADMKVSPIDLLPLELVALDLCQASPTENRERKTENGGQRAEGGRMSKASVVDEPKAPAATSEVAVAPRINPAAPKSQTILNGEQRATIIEAVGLKNKPLAALLSQAEWEAAPGTVCFKVEYPLHRDKIMSKKMLLLLETEAAAAAGEDIRVDCKVEKGSSAGAEKAAVPEGEDLSGEIEGVFETA